MIKRKYPICMESFREIREKNFLYIDKTQLIHRLIHSGNYYFLNRPRRFGKSLLLSTIKEIFCGSKELFGGLWMGSKWNWERTHPVVNLKISHIDYHKLGLYEALSREIETIADKFQVSLNNGIMVIHGMGRTACIILSPSFP